MQKQSDSAIGTGWAAFGAVSSAIFTGIALLVLWAIPQFTNNQIWNVEVSTISVSIPLQLLGLWNGLVALTYLGLVPGLWTKNPSAYEAGLKLAQLNLVLLYLQTQQGRAVSLSDIFIMGGNFSLLLATWAGKTLIAQERSKSPVGSHPITHAGDVASIRYGDVQADDKVGLLLNALSSSQRGTRIQAVQALASIGGPAVEPLVHALSHAPDHIRIDASDALGQIGDSRALPELERLAREGKNSEVASAASRAAARIRKQMKDQ